MSLIEKLLERKSSQSGFLCAIGGARLAGKSTLAGTLPGRTLVIQPKGIEAGNSSPIVLAKELGNHVDMIEFSEYKQAHEILKDKAILSYDNIYIDGISAFTEMVFNSPTFVAASASNKWDGFSLIKDETTKLVVTAKSLASEHDKNVFITYALKNRFDANGNPIAIEMVAQGNATKDLIEGKCPNVIVVYLHVDEETQVSTRKLLTANNGPYVARLGDLLDTNNPKVLDADLSKLLQAANRTFKNSK